MTATTIAWTCDECGQPIFGTGYLGITHAELAEIESRRMGRIRWHVWHDACHPDDAAAIAYDVDIDHVRTVTGALHWTEHLSEKNWYHRTNWVVLMALKGVDVTPREYAPPSLARADALWS